MIVQNYGEAASDYFYTDRGTTCTIEHHNLVLHESGLLAAAA